MLISSPTPRELMLREKSSGAGSICGSGVVWSESSSISKKTAPGMCVARYRARVSTLGVTPTGGSVASRTTVLGPCRRSSNHDGVTRGFIELDYLVPSKLVRIRSVRQEVVQHSNEQIILSK